MIDDEQIENSLADAILVQSVLGMDLDQFDRYKTNVSFGFIRFGTYFHRCIGKALKCASLKDAVKILNMWPNDAAEMDISYRIWLAQENK